MIEPWINYRSRKRCPVCRYHRTYAGPICPKCKALGYKPAQLPQIPRRRKTALVKLLSSIKADGIPKYGLATDLLWLLEQKYVSHDSKLQITPSGELLLRKLKSHSSLAAK
jgi:hypothetical protein